MGNYQDSPKSPTQKRLLLVSQKPRNIEEGQLSDHIDGLGTDITTLRGIGRKF